MGTWARIGDRSYLRRNGTPQSPIRDRPSHRLHTAFLRWPPRSSAWKPPVYVRSGDSRQLPRQQRHVGRSVYRDCSGSRVAPSGRYGRPVKLRRRTQTATISDGSSRATECCKRDTPRSWGACCAPERGADIVAPYCPNAHRAPLTPPRDGRSSAVRRVVTGIGPDRAPRCHCPARHSA